MPSGGWLKFLGFALPISIALDNGASPGRDAKPRAGLCSFCRRVRDRLYAVGEDQWMCDVDIKATLNSKPVRTALSHRRSIDEVPFEVVNPYGPEIDPLWDRSFQ